MLQNLDSFCYFTLQGCNSLEWSAITNLKGFFPFQTVQTWIDTGMEVLFMLKALDKVLKLW